MIAKNQFTLQSLAIAITIISLVFATAVTFPIATAQMVTVNLLLIAPAATIFGVAFWLSKNRRRTKVILLIGICLGWLLSPRIYVIRTPPPTFWDRFIIDFESIGLFMFGGAVAAAVLDLIVALVRRNPNTE